MRTNLFDMSQIYNQIWKETETILKEKFYGFVEYVELQSFVSKYI